MKRISIYLILMALILTSCEKLVYINIKDGEQKIVLSGLICPDSTVVVQITRTTQVSSMGPADTSLLHPKPMVVDEVSLYENDLFIGQLSRKVKDYYELPDFHPTTGKTYRIEALSGEMEPVSATAVVPELVSLNSFDTARISTEEGSPAYRVNMQITDPAGQENFYALQVVLIQGYYDFQHDTFADSLVSIPYYPRLGGKVDDVLDLDFLDVNRDVYCDQKLLFSDQLFDGKVFGMSFEISKAHWYRTADTVLFRVELHQVDKSYYQYAVSYQKYRQASNNPFSEPVQIYSNVKNGFGLFSAYNGVMKEFVVDWTR